MTLNFHIYVLGIVIGMSNFIFQEFGWQGQQFLHLNRY